VDLWASVSVLVANIIFHFFITVTTKVIMFLWLTWYVGYTDVPYWTFPVLLMNCGSLLGVAVVM